ncbi:MAG: hypothetical protein ACFFCE_10220 [Promethearchaeota archaeon]
MSKSEIKKRIKALIFLILIIGTFSTFLNIIPKSSTEKNIQSDEIIKDETNLFDIKNDSLKTADYSSTTNGTGKNLNVTLHQSLTNTTEKEFLNLDNANTFKAACPLDTDFNSSYIDITIEEINAPNKSIIVEDDNIDNWQNLDQVFASFEVQGTGYIENISVFMTHSGAGTYRLVDFYICPAEIDNGNLRPVDASLSLLYSGLNVTTTNWYNITNIHDPFDSSTTINNTFFLYTTHSTGTGTINWGVVYDIEGDGVNESIVLDSSEMPITFTLLEVNTIDLRLKLGVAPLNNTPSPEQIGLKIDNKTANGYGDGINSGYWTSNETKEGILGSLTFELKADWWEVSCNITKVQINYTKTNIRASTAFNISKYGQPIEWNATLGIINDFKTTFDNYRINFTVPKKWSNFQAFNDTGNNLSDNTTLGSPQGGYMEYQIYNASNGPNWYITAESDNLIHAINTLVNSVKTNTTNYGETIDIIGNFTETIKDGKATVEIYSPDFSGNYLNYSNYNDTITSNNEVALGSWIITDTPMDYGQFRVQVFWSNDTAAGFFEKNLTILALTDLLLIGPEDRGRYYNNDTFNINVYYNDTGQELPIIDATVGSNNSNARPFYPTGTDGYYTREINTSDFNYGWNYIEINASKIYHNNDSYIFSFEKIINTTIYPGNIRDFGDIIKGDTVSYLFNYSDINHDFIENAVIQEVDVDPSFIWSSTPESQGNYTITLNTTNVNASPTPYICNFNISATGNETQTISLQLRVVMTQTFIDIQSYNSTLIRKDRLNQTVTFYFNDTDNNIVIPGLNADTITVIDNQTGLPRSKWLYTPGPSGFYGLNISMLGLNSGSIRFWINVSLPPNYNWSLTFIDFYLRGNLTDIPKISLSDPNGQGALTTTGGNYSIFEERDLYVDFNITDTDYNGNLITSAMDSYTIEFIEIGNSTNQGFLNQSISFDANTNSFKGYLSITELPRIGAYTLTIRTTKTNYEETDISFNLIIKARYIVELSVVSQPEEVTAGDTFRIIFEVQYNNGSDWFPLEASTIIITPIFNNIVSQEVLTKSTNNTGGVFFDITVARDVLNMSLSVRLEAEYYHAESLLEISDISINPAPSGFNFEDLLPYLIIIGAAVAVGGGSFAVYRGVIVPKKREKARILTEVKTIFDDAISLEHVLVLYKGTGVCIYFKSFGSEQIDPELISGFISAISSFGKDLVCQEELNEISYGDKMLLLSDGEFIRVALVLSKQASLILRRNLMEFIHTFEKVYAENLPKWRGQLNIFRDAGIIIDDIFSTSIILPHEITYEHSSVKTLKKPQSREVIKIAENLMKDSERNFFFIATLLKESTEKTGKDTAEVFMGIKELRDNKILMPIEISTIEKKPISQQEINLINQKVGTLVNLSPEEREKLVNDLAQLGPAEREAYFVSIKEQHEIVSAPIESESEITIIENQKQANKEIKILKKKALNAKKEKDYEKCLRIYQNAAKIALDWEITKESYELDDTIRKTKIEDLTIKMKNLEKEAKLAAKKEKFNEATQKYKVSSKIASEIFKLGVDDMTKEVKRLTNKSKEYEKLI